MRRLAARLVATLWIAGGLAAGALPFATAARAEVRELWPLGPDVEAALSRIRGGDAAGGAAVLQALADRGRTDAAYVLGITYMVGRPGVTKDPARACALWKQASVDRPDATHAYAAECLEKGGGGVTRDLAQARVWYRRAADGGYTRANCALGNMMVAGDGGPVDVAGGIALCRKGAEAGEADAQTDLANYYLMGQVIPRDVAAARGWYEKAAAQKQINASFVLGQIYWNGDTIPKDYARAAALWRVAFDGGRRDAADLLGNVAFVRYVDSLEAKHPDKAARDEAIGWYRIAVSELPPGPRRDDAQKRLDLLLGGEP